MGVQYRFDSRRRANTRAATPRSSSAITKRDVSASSGSRRRTHDAPKNKDEMLQHSPPEAEILPRRGTRGVMFSRSSAPMRSISSQRTPEWPRMSEFMRIRMAPRTHDSGMLVVVRGSPNGSAGSGASVCVGRTPVCWCCRSAWPSWSGSFVRVSAVREEGEPVEDSEAMWCTHHFHRILC